MQWCEYKQLLGESRFGSGSSKEGHKKMIVGLECVGGREWWVPGSRALPGAFETEGLEGCWGDSGANRRFAELAPQHVRRRVREPGTHHSRPGFTQSPHREVFRATIFSLRVSLSLFFQISPSASLASKIDFISS